MTGLWKDKTNPGTNPSTPNKPVEPIKPSTPTVTTPIPYWFFYGGVTPTSKKRVEVKSTEIEIILTVGSYKLQKIINGKSFTTNMDVAPYIKDGRVMLPVRYVAETMDFDVDWNRSTRTVLIKAGSDRVEIPVDTNKIIVNGNVYLSDVKPEIKNNRTMLPIANIARALGLQDGKDIIWNSHTKTATIKMTK